MKIILSLQSLPTLKMLPSSKKIRGQKVRFDSKFSYSQLKSCTSSPLKTSKIKKVFLDKSVAGKRIEETAAVKKELIHLQKMVFEQKLKIQKGGT